MDFKDFESKLFLNLERDEVFKNVPMSKYTSFKVGGNTDYLVQPKRIESIKQTINLCKAYDIPYFIMGNGSNLLVNDQGFRGVIIQLYKSYSNVEACEDGIIEAQAGVLLSSLANKICEASLSGFEFASGIPGTLGGAVFMNAGAYDGQMKDVILSATVMNSDGEIRVLPLESLELGYRNSILQKTGEIVLSAKLKLKPGIQKEIQDKTRDLNGRRKEKQPLEMPSAGSTFKRPEGYYAGKLIMDAGLRGYTLGGAQVSEKHCGFVVNKGNATAEDIVALIQHIKQQVFKQFGVKMSPEVKYLGQYGIESLI